MSPSGVRLIAVIALAFYVISASANDCTESSDPCGKPTAWNEFETIQLRTTQQGAPGVMASLLQVSRSNNDLRIDIDIADPKQPQHGTILMVAGRVFVSTGLTLTPGAEIDALDGPLLYSILAVKILGRALPSGPAALAGRQKIAHQDPTTGIQFATPSAEGFIRPPWSVSGTMTPKPDHSVDFDLVLTWAEADAPTLTHEAIVGLKGQLKHQGEFRIDDAMPLKGWSVFGVGPIVEHTATGTRMDYGAKATTRQPSTIGDIRRQLEIDDSPGQADLSLSLAGFWKHECADGFGMRIKPAEPSGMYTVTFCGPGECGEPERERKTFITGDRRYKVVSPVELEFGVDGNRTTYKKCSDGMLP